MSTTQIAIDQIGATGTPGSGNFLRGDGTWSAPSAAPTTSKYVLGASDAALPNGLVLGTNVVMKGLDASKPTAGTAGRLYFSTDISGGTLYRDNGSSWDQVATGLTAAPQAHESTHEANGSDALPWTTIHGSGTLASRPAAATTNAGYIYLATDVSGGTLYRSDGSGWTQIAASVSAGGSSTLAGDSDVSITSPSNGQVLTYNGSTSKWTNQSGTAGNVTTSTATGSEPSSPATGDLDLLTDGPILERYGGSAWAPRGPSFPFTAPPAAGSLTTTNLGSCTVTKANGGILFSGPSNGGSDSWRLATVATPGTPYKAVFYLLPSFGGQIQYGPVWYDTGTTKLITMRFVPNTGLYVTQWNSTTSFVGNPASIGSLPAIPMGSWARLRDDGTTRYYELSGDGQNWYTSYSEARTNFITPNQVGIGFDPGGNPGAVLILSWYVGS
jgi:hypothetical protein